jgi:hypothetical protein
VEVVPGKLTGLKKEGMRRKRIWYRGESRSGREAGGKREGNGRGTRERERERERESEWERPAKDNSESRLSKDPRDDISMPCLQNNSNYPRYTKKNTKSNTWDSATSARSLSHWLLFSFCPYPTPLYPPPLAPPIGLRRPLAAPSPPARPYKTPFYQRPTPPNIVLSDYVFCTLSAEDLLCAAVLKHFCPKDSRDAEALQSKTFDSRYSKLSDLRALKVLFLCPGIIIKKPTSFK